MANPFGRGRQAPQKAPATVCYPDIHVASPALGVLLVCVSAAASAQSSVLLDAMSEELNRSEEHTSELQSLRHIVCRLLLEKKKKATCAQCRSHVRPATAAPARLLPHA